MGVVAMLQTGLGKLYQCC